MNKTYILLLNYNGWRDTQECLESVLKLDYPNYQIIVVDNNSPNNSMGHLIAWAKGREEATVDNSLLENLSTPHTPKPLDFLLYDKQIAVAGGNLATDQGLNNPIIFIQTGENRGFAAGNNIGIEYALKKGDADYIWCLNNDTVVEPDALTALVNRAEIYKDQGCKVGIMGSKLMYYYQPDLIQAVSGEYNPWLATTSHVGALEKDNGQYDMELSNQQISYPVGASMFVDVAFIKDVGMMCEDYFLFFEELDWVHRGFKKGWSTGYCWGSKIFHKEGGSVGSNSTANASNRSEIADLYGLRNRFAFQKKFYPNRLFILVLWLFGSFMKRLIRYNKKDLNIFFRALIYK